MRKLLAAVYSVAKHHRSFVAKLSHGGTEPAWRAHPIIKWLVTKA
jgi:hypothetical protein